MTARDMEAVPVSKSRAICGIEGRNMSMDTGAMAVRATSRAVAGIDSARAGTRVTD
ncbi:MAG: hypothetical protein R3C29_03095 [Dehalococcoidia bacterium]